MRAGMIIKWRNAGNAPAPTTLYDGRTCIRSMFFFSFLFASFFFFFFFILIFDFIPFHVSCPAAAAAAAVSLLSEYLHPDPAVFKTWII
jgi:hypothetical protein